MLGRRDRGDVGPVHLGQPQQGHALDLHQPAAEAAGQPVARSAGVGPGQQRGPAVLGQHRRHLPHQRRPEAAAPAVGVHPELEQAQVQVVHQRQQEPGAAGDLAVHPGDDEGPDPVGVVRAQPRGQVGRHRRWVGRLVERGGGGPDGQQAGDVRVGQAGGVESLDLHG